MFDPKKRGGDLVLHDRRTEGVEGEAREGNISESEHH